MLRVGRQDDTLEIEMQRRDLEEIEKALMEYGNVLNSIGNNHAKTRIHRLREELSDKIREEKLPDGFQEQIPEEVKEQMGDDSNQEIENASNIQELQKMLAKELDIDEDKLNQSAKKDTYSGQQNPFNREGWEEILKKVKQNERKS
jgi:hypothetical protein